MGACITSSSAVTSFTVETPDERTLHIAPALKLTACSHDAVMSCQQVTSSTHSNSLGMGFH
eukprot:5990575-Amphidinium_carterae.1